MWLFPICTIGCCLLPVSCCGIFARLFVQQKVAEDNLAQSFSTFNVSYSVRWQCRALVRPVRSLLVCA